MSSYISVPDPITPDWLTTVLQQSGMLQRGEVVSVTKRDSGAFNSQIGHLLLGYSADSPSDAPTQLVLKRNTTEAWSIEAGAEEVKFYNLVGSLHHPPVIPPCYAAAYDEASGNSYVLLQDLSETHAPPITRDQQIGFVEGVPPVVHIDAVVDTLAQLHAYWWEHPLLNTNTFHVGYWSRNADRFSQYLQRRKTSWESLIENESEWLPADVRELYEEVFARLPHHWDHFLEPRFRTKTHLTLVHGDAYFCNFLCPRHTTNTEGKPMRSTYLLDWQSPTFDVGAYDLVNLCAAYWTPEQRHEDDREQRILRHYHQNLLAHGVQNYLWDDLVADYKTGIIYWILVPVQDCFGGASRDYWWPKMQCLVAAFREWDCLAQMCE